MTSINSVNSNSLLVVHKESAKRGKKRGATTSEDARKKERKDPPLKIDTVKYILQPTVINGSKERGEKALEELKELLKRSPEGVGLQAHFAEDKIYFTHMCEELTLLSEDPKSAFHPFFCDENGKYADHESGGSSQKGLWLSLEGASEEELVEPLLEEASTYFSQLTIPRPVDFKVDETVPIPQILQLMLKTYPGIFFGDIHDDPYPKEMLSDNFPLLKEAGVSTLFIEGLSYDTLQTSLDIYGKSSNETMPFVLQRVLEGLDEEWNLKGKGSITHMVRMARKAEIRLVGLETTVAMELNGQDREFAIKYLAAQIIPHEMKKKKEGEKFAVFTGLSHTTAWKGGALYEISELFQCPSVFVESKDKTKDEVKVNLRNLISNEMTFSHIHLYQQKSSQLLS